VLKAFDRKYPKTYDDAAQAGVPLHMVPHYTPCPDPERASAPWTGAYALDPPDLQKMAPNIKKVQTPQEEDWSAVDQPLWARPGLPHA